MIWVIFIACVLVLLALDLFVINKKAHVVQTKEAAIWTSIWVLLAFAFSGVIYLLYSNGSIANPTNLTANQAVLKYITGYLIELSLSIDNVFVIAVIFSSFGIPAQYQHRVLFWGILGAIVFRAMMILFGVVLINKFDWVIYVFGVFLLYTAFKMATSSGTKFDPKTSKLYRFIRKLFPVTKSIEGEHFFIKKMGIRAATPLFVALLIIELTDILFALDSIPAILAITSDPFIVFSSNILAILGLRSMYFLISRMLQKFRYINYSLVAILSYVGVKMLISHHVEIPEWLSLAVIAVSLAAGIIASLTIPISEETINDQ